MQIEIVIPSEFLDIGGLGRVAALGVAHRRVNNVARSGERVGGKPPETAGSPGDDDNLFHDMNPVCDGSNRK
jgi:hypothetical protein